jgi:hypothetical protein
MLKLLRWRGSRSVHGLRHVLSHEIRRSHNALPVRSYTSAISPALTQQAAVAPRDTSPGLPSKGITLRNYQLESIEAVLKAFEEGKRQVGVSLATGSGKTVRECPLRASSQILTLLQGHLHRTDRTRHSSCPWSDTRPYPCPPPRTRRTSSKTMQSQISVQEGGDRDGQPSCFWKS